ncbi:MAG: ATP-grasp domain-containing protein [Nocardiopsaceae bacterium]|nr:ATP-grasp domain-containing protein [Nocardiopsaceae bacterium]
MTRGFRRILVANRGEIAARVIRTCRRLGIEAVLAVSDTDAGSLPARLADSVIRIGPAAAGASYLSVDAVVAAAEAAGVDAVHPGYGFLSENPRLARACADAGIVFIGPAPETLEAAGDKLAARRHAADADLPLLQADEEVIGFPVLVKAAGGGGGRGLRVVRDPADLDAAVAMASAEADAAFGDPRVYLERYVSPARHVEVQILGDGDRVVHLGDRDCSVQRRYQKLIEEAPAPLLGDELRTGLREAAVALGDHLSYRGAGTVEFLVDPARESFYFLEVNARIQVEHPVTEAVTGLDLVAEQIAIAEGRPLRLRQDDVTISGHAIECRINAEDPDRGFRPSPGTITRAVFPADPALPGDISDMSGWKEGPPCREERAGTRAGSPPVRIDTHVQGGSSVPPHYDSLLAKVIARGRDRDEALARLRGALARCDIRGVATNLRLQASLLASAEFARGGVGTDWLEKVAGGQSLLPVR